MRDRDREREREIPRVTFQSVVERARKKEKKRKKEGRKREAREEGERVCRHTELRGKKDIQREADVGP